jgi:histone H3/H4
MDIFARWHSAATRLFLINLAQMPKKEQRGFAFPGALVHDFPVPRQEAPLDPRTQLKEIQKMSEILVVTSKVKSYIKDKSGMNTQGALPEELSKRLATILDKAIENAKADGRKTVMDRDVPAGM